MARGRPKSTVFSKKCDDFWKAFELLGKHGGCVTSGTAKYTFDKAVDLIKSIAAGTARRFNPDKEWTWELRIS
jgi:hypothetical protein